MWTPKVQIKYVDTNNQLADMLTKGSFTRDEWNHPVRLLNIIDSSMSFCGLFLKNFLSDLIRKEERHVQERSRDDFQ